MINANTLKINPIYVENCIGVRRALLNANNLNYVIKWPPHSNKLFKCAHTVFYTIL